MPAAFVAAMPPSVASAPGSTGKKSPCFPASRFSCIRVTPGLHRRCQVPRADVPDPTHPGQVEADPAPHRDRRGPRGSTRHRTARRGFDARSRARARAPPQRRSPEDDHIGTARRVEAEVGGVEVEDRLPVRDARFVGDELEEVVPDRHRHRIRGISGAGLVARLARATRVRTRKAPRETAATASETRTRTSTVR